MSKKTNKQKKNQTFYTLPPIASVATTCSLDHGNTEDSGVWGAQGTHICDCEHLGPESMGHTHMYVPRSGDKGGGGGSTEEEGSSATERDELARRGPRELGDSSLTTSLHANLPA